MSDEPAIGTAGQFFVAAEKATKTRHLLTPYELRVLDSTHADLAIAARRKAAAWQAAQAAEAQRRAAAPAATQPTATQLLIDVAFTDAWTAALGGDAGADSAWGRTVMKHADVPVTMAALDLLVCQAAFYHHTRLKALAAEIAALKQQLAEIQARPTGATYKGVWDTTVKYERDEMVTHSGSCWIARVENISTRPGTAPHCWQLVAKRGADGKDLR